MMVGRWGWWGGGSSKVVVGQAAISLRQWFYGGGGFRLMRSVGRPFSSIPLVAAAAAVLAAAGVVASVRRFAPPRLALMKRGLGSTHVPSRPEEDAPPHCTLGGRTCLLGLVRTHCAFVTCVAALRCSPRSLNFPALPC